MRWHLMIAGATIALALAAAGTDAAERKLRYLVGVTGSCNLLVVENLPLPCEGTLIQAEYDDGRVGFHFIATEPEGLVVSFSGPGQMQKAPSADVRILPVDGVIKPGIAIHATGECLFENPYAGPARVECAARSGSGKEFRGRFLTDGSEPNVTDLGGGDG